MKKKHLIFIVLCISSILTFGQNSIEAYRLDIKRLIVDSFEEIWSEFNSENMEKYYTEDFLLLENGEVWNNDSIANYLDNTILKKPNPKRKNTVKIIEIIISPK
jgi:hypothetical protein